MTFIKGRRAGSRVYKVKTKKQEQRMKEVEMMLKLPVRSAFVTKEHKPPMRRDPCLISAESSGGDLAETKIKHKRESCDIDP